MNRALQLLTCVATCAALGGAVAAPAVATDPSYPNKFKLTKVKNFHVVDVSSSTNVFKPSAGGDEYTLTLDAGAQFQFEGSSTWYNLVEVAGFYQIYDGGKQTIDRSTNTGWDLDPNAGQSQEWEGFNTPMAGDSAKSLGLFRSGTANRVNAGTMHDDPNTSNLGTFTFGPTSGYTGNIAFGFHIRTDDPSGPFGSGMTGFVYWDPSKPPEEVPEPAAVQLASLLALSGVGLWRARARKA